ncbi:MAG: TnpV protein [Anaerolineaceae bacterium]|nr:TnpV protein [Anaerolineaceae bacterium]
MKNNLPEKVSQNGMDYTLHGDYYLPDIALGESDSKPVGRWGLEYKHYLEQNRSGLYNRLILSGELYSTLHDLDRQAQERYETIVFQMKAAEGVTESLKADNQMEWVRRMNNIRNRAEEVIREEMIYN